MPAPIEEGAKTPGHHSPGHHIELVDDHPSPRHEGEAGSPALRNSKGWDGKLRVPKSAVLANPEALSDPEYSDEDNVVPGEEVAADEGKQSTALKHIHWHFPCLKDSGRKKQWQ